MSDYFFSKNHLWVKFDGEFAEVGITNYAQEKLGNVVFLNLPDSGDCVEIGKAFGDIESIKTVSDLISPIDGEIVLTNDDLVDEIDSINDNPMDCWFIKVKATRKDDALMTEEQYSLYLEAI